MAELKELTTPELNRLRGYLTALEVFVTGINYLTHFEVKGLELIDTTFDAPMVLKKAYPESHPDQGQMIEISYEDMVKSVNSGLKLPDPPFSDPGLHSEIQNNLTNGFWDHLTATVDLEEATVLAYVPDKDSNDELRDFVYWGFTLLLYNERQRRCVIVHGGASD